MCVGRLMAEDGNGAFPKHASHVSSRWTLIWGPFGVIQLKENHIYIYIYIILNIHGAYLVTLTSCDSNMYSHILYKTLTRL